MNRHIKIYEGQGYVSLLDVIPNDIPEGFSSRDAEIANSARLSKSGKCKNNLEVYALLEKLFKWGHFSPFEQAVLRFEIKAPLVFFWQCDRHRTFQYGSHLRRSGRYTEFDENDLYIPEYVTNKMFAPDEFNESEHYFTEVLSEHTAFSIDLYKRALDSGVEKEVARFLLPAYCLMYTEVMTVDLKNLMHFLSLRTNLAAQTEIRIVANVIYDIVSDLFPYTMKIFSENERPAVNYDFGDA